MNKPKKKRVTITLDEDVCKYVKESGICLSYTINYILKYQAKEFYQKQKELEL